MDEMINNGFAAQATGVSLTCSSCGMPLDAANGAEFVTCPICGNRTDIRLRTVEYNVDNSQTNHFTYVSIGQGATKTQKDAEWFAQQNLDLPQIDMPNGILTVPGGLFWGRGLKSIKLSNDLVEIGESAFCDCTDLRNVTIPSGVKKIGESAFENCDSLTTITIPAGAYVGDSAFRGCTNLHEVKIGSGCRLGNDVFRGCPSLYRVDMGEGTSMGDATFKGCKNLRMINLPVAMEALGERFFEGCTSLQTLDLPPRLRSIRGAAFSGCAQLETIAFPDSLKMIATNAFRGCTQLREAVIPSNCVLGDGVFLDCTSLSRASIQDGITTISAEAFKGCTSLRSVRLPFTVISLKSFAFAGCQRLKDVEFVGVVCHVGKYAFSNCSSLETPGEAIFEPDAFAFEGCIQLHSLTLGGHIAPEALAGCTSLETLAFADGVTTLPNSLCAGVSSLRSISLPPTLKSIGNRAFEGCSSLQDFAVPSSLQQLGEAAFAGCSGLQNVVLREARSLKSIPAQAFAGCESLRALQLPIGITSIGREAYKGCLALSAAVLPSNLKALEWGCFCDCSSIQRVVFQSATPPNAYAPFTGCTALYEVNAPTSFYQNAAGVDVSNLFEGAAIHSVLMFDSEGTDPSTYCPAFGFGTVSVNESSPVDWMSWIAGPEKTQEQPRGFAKLFGRK